MINFNQQELLDSSIISLNDAIIFYAILTRQDLYLERYREKIYSFDLVDIARVLLRKRFTLLMSTKQKNALYFRVDEEKLFSVFRARTFEKLSSHLWPRHGLTHRLSFLRLRTPFRSYFSLIAFLISRHDNQRFISRNLRIDVQPSSVFSCVIKSIVQCELSHIILCFYLKDIFRVSKTFYSKKIDLKQQISTNRFIFSLL